jgi:hypothetical protein
MLFSDLVSPKVVECAPRKRVVSRGSPAASSRKSDTLSIRERNNWPAVDEKPFLTFAPDRLHARGYTMPAGSALQRREDRDGSEPFAGIV